MRIVHELCDHHKNKFAKQWTIDIEHWKNNMDYFGEAYTLCEEFDLLKLMNLNCPFDVQLIHQFYANVHFGTYETHTLNFMCHNEIF